MKISHFNHSDKYGGAARYVNRIVECQLENGLQSKLFVNVKKTSSDNVSLLGKIGITRIDTLVNRFFQFGDQMLNLLEIEKEHNFKSPGIFGSVNIKKLNKLDVDIIHLHWINGGFFSINQISHIKKPIFWSILDMWPFSGAEHYLNINDESRIKLGYNKESRPGSSKGLDISRISWKLKLKKFQNFTMVYPGEWLKTQSSKSEIISNMKNIVIPPPVNLKVFTRINKKESRKSQDLPQDEFLVGYFGGTSTRKGFAIIRELILSDFLIKNNIKMVLVGNDFPSNFKEHSHLIMKEKITNDEKLSLIYSCLDIVLVPSKQEAYGLVAQEAQACGVPVISTGGTGLEDVITDNVTGISVNSYSAHEFAHAILGILNNKSKQLSFSSNAFRKSKLFWDYKQISNKFSSAYANEIKYLGKQL